MDILKLDIAFTALVAKGPERSRLARAIVELAHAFELQVIAEGVERREQAESLVALGCTRAQGFLFARPMPPDELFDLLGEPIATRVPGGAGATRLNGVPPRPRGRRAMAARQTSTSSG